MFGFLRKKRAVVLELGTPLEPVRKIPEADYDAIRAILKALAADGKHFAYCKDDDTLIWHEGRGPWERDDNGARFLEFAGSKRCEREATLALAYFKKSCISSHIDRGLKAKRLAPQRSTK